MQLLQYIACINHLANTKAQTGNRTLPMDLPSLTDRIEQQLQTLQQRTDILFDKDNVRMEPDLVRISRTAELYRIAALIYIHEAVIQKPTSSLEIQALVEMALAVLGELEVCTSPWPLFVVACEVIGDEQRMIILDILEKMQKERRIGNVEIIRTIIEAVWKRTDLNTAANLSARIDWRDLVDTSRQIPSFI